MSILHRFKKYVPAYLNSLFERDAQQAYDIWASHYDEQPDNLMLALDEGVFSELISEISFRNKIIADVGCGTGRHWEKIYAKQPTRLIGYDVSDGMLRILKKKFPEAETHILKTNYLKGLENNSCDIIISTLAIAHIKNIEEAFAEWSRVLKTDGQFIITDYHPDTLSKGGNRTFTHNGKKIAIKNYVHPIEQVKKIMEKLYFKTETFIEKKIDETVKSYYEKQNALPVFERFKGTPIIYGIYLTRRNAAE